MGNNFLRYKLLFLARASPEEIYTSVKNITPTLNGKITSKLANSLLTRTEFNTNFAINVKSIIANSSLLDLDINLGNIYFTGYSIIANSMQINVDMTSEYKSTVILKYCASKIVFTRFNSNLSAKILSKLVDSFHCSSIELSQQLELYTDTNIAQSIDKESNITVSSLIKFKSTADNAINLTTSVNSQLLNKVTSSITRTINPKIRCVTNTNLKVEISLYYLTKLKDIALLRLADLDGQKLNKIKFVEIK